MATKKKKPAKKSAPKKVSKKISPKKAAGFPIGDPVVRKNTIYIHHSAFQPVNSSDGVVDNFQSGRHTAIANKSLSAPIILPVGAKIKSMSIHYTNSTTTNPMAVFLRLHSERVAPSGEIEMSFINMPPGVLPPDNFLTVVDTTFPDSGLIKDKYLHYVEINGTGNFGAGGKVTIRGVSIKYTY